MKTASEEILSCRFTTSQEEVLGKRHGTFALFPNLVSGLISKRRLLGGVRAAKAAPMLQWSWGTLQQTPTHKYLCIYVSRLDSA